jgi:hypothetical protein
VVCFHRVKYGKIELLVLNLQNNYQLSLLAFFPPHPALSKPACRQAGERVEEKPLKPSNLETVLERPANHPTQAASIPITF